MYMDKKRCFASLLGMILSLVIIGILCIMLLRSYQTAVKTDKASNGMLKEEGIDSSNSRTLVETTRQKVNEINAQLLEKEKKYNSMLE
jgi:hypothetical protein